MVADAANDDPARHARLAFCAAAGAVTAIDAVLLTTFENRMLGDDVAQIEDADQIGESREEAGVNRPARARQSPWW